MIKVNNVTKYYGKFLAVEDLQFEVGKGEIVAFLGPNGAGKTTTMRIITGFMAPTYGDVYIDGIDVFENMEEAQSIIGYLPENPPVYNDLTVSEYLHFVAELKKVPSDKIKERVDTVMEMTGIQERRNTLIAFLSKGFRQRVGVAQSIVNSPKVLIMDEPTVGLDPKQVIEIRNLITRLAKSEKQTIILSTHIMAEASAVTQKALIINEGHIVGEGNIDDLREKMNLSEGKSHHIFLSVLRKAEELEKMLKSVEHVREINRDGNQFEVITNEDIREIISQKAVESGSGLVKLDQRLDTLEDIFVKMVR